MVSKIVFRNFEEKIKKNKKIKLINYLKKLDSQNWPEFLNSFKKEYVYGYDKNFTNKFKNIQNINIIGMGGSSLGAKAIYNFLKKKIKKKFIFNENLNIKNNIEKKRLNIIISKSGNTLETISNFNTVYHRNNKNIFITEKTNGYLNKLAKKLKCDVVEHKNFIGGRFSVLSEVGMLPAQLMGLKERKFKQYNNLITKKKFLDALTHNVLSTYELIKKKKI